MAKGKRKNKRKQPNVAVDAHPDKRPHVAVKPGEKKPRVAVHTKDENDNVYWELLHLDDLFADWKKDAKIGDVRQLLDRLQHIERQGWSGIAKQKFLNRSDHLIPRGKLCKDAQNRLVKLELDDQDELLSIHVTGRKRAWAVRIGDSSIARVLWWDPDHRVYPVAKKNT